MGPGRADYRDEFLFDQFFAGFLFAAADYGAAEQSPEHREVCDFRKDFAGFLGSVGIEGILGYCEVLGEFGVSSCVVVRKAGRRVTETPPEQPEGVWDIVLYGRSSECQFIGSPDPADGFGREGVIGFDFGALVNDDRSVFECGR